MKTLEDQVARMEKTADDFAAAIKGLSEAVLSKRPDDKNWAAKEIICHLRDTEELFMKRFQTIIGTDEPKFIPAEADRWAAERQYRLNDALDALSSFRRRREEVLEFLRGLKPEQLERGGIHPTRGRMSIKDLVALIAGHDQNHLEQLQRTLAV